MDETGAPASLAAGTIWAKTNRGQEPAMWLPLWTHMDDSAGIVGRLWDSWLTPGQRQLLVDGFGLGEAIVKSCLRFLAGAHDVGKATPAFVIQNAELASLCTAEGLRMAATIPATERRKLPHALASAAILNNWLISIHGWSQSAAIQFAGVVGGHHGIPPQFDSMKPLQIKAHPDLYGGQEWRVAQFALLDRLARSSGFEQHAATVAAAQLPESAQVLLSGIVVMSDWLASNAYLCPLEAWTRQPSVDAQRIAQAWRRAALPAPWKSAGFDISGIPLHERFGIPESAQVRPIQQAAVEAASTMDPAGIMVIEAPMGEGKTEAALLAVEILAKRSGASGAFIALPTQATTDAMFQRVQAWIDRLPGGGASIHLAHGRATLNPAYTELVSRGTPQDIGSDECDDCADDHAHEGLGAYVNSWMADRRKGVLADFVVGTVDQVLFVALKARYLVLRHLGMSRKVVVIDEVHAYDAYMSVYLERALEWLGAYQVPVVLLSATLPRATRAKLTQAYVRGTKSNTRRVPTSLRDRLQPQEAVDPVSEEPAGTPASHSASHYPVVSYTQGFRSREMAVPPSGRQLHVDVDWVDGDTAAVVRTLDTALAEGGCALVVCNTVARAQRMAEAISTALDVPVLLNHARFMGHDRSCNDQRLLREFGRPDAEGNSKERPDRAVVVATQVVEQSLDIDFDLLITDIAPTDILLQRIGRLHRHGRGAGETRRPAGLRSARCLIAGVKRASDGQPVFDGGDIAVYGEHHILRAAVILDEVVAAGGLELPHDIDPLVQRAYDEMPIGPSHWQARMDAAFERMRRDQTDSEQRAGAFRLGSPRPPAPEVSLLGWLHGSIGEADESARGRAQVRDVDDSIEVILLLRDGDELRVPDWIVHDLAGEIVPQRECPDQELAAAAAGCVVRLPREVCVGKRGDALVAHLEQALLPAWQRSPVLRGQLVLPLDGDRHVVVNGFEFSYDPLRGLEVHRHE